MSIHRIDELFSFEKGSLQSSKCEAGKYKFITASADWKSHNEFTYDGEALVFAAAAAGSLGRTHYVNDKFTASDLCFVLTPKNQADFPLDLKFYHLIFRELRSDIVKNTKAGTSKEAISLTKFGKYELPYFDIEKQNEIKNRFVGAEATKAKLIAELNHQLALVKELRQTYLREAMQGKLVPQDSNDEPAKILLEKITAEKEKLVAEKKIKREKPLPPINPGEVPFVIHTNWIWCRVGTVLGTLTDYHANGSYEILRSKVNLSETENYAIMLRTTNFHENNYDNYKYISKEAYNFLDKSKVFPGDVIMNKIGDPGSVFFVDDRRKPMSLAMNLFLLRFSNHINSYYAFSYLKAFPDYVKSFSAGTTNLTITKDAVKNLIFPLPPSAEQQRIVAKLEKLMESCDELEANIRKGIANADRLLQTALKEALEPKDNQSPEITPLD